jgi:hypothetical protein
MEGEAASPVLGDEKGRADSHLRDERVEMAGLILEAIGDVRLARLAKTDEVGSDAMGCWRDERETLDEVGLPWRKSPTRASREPASR